MENRREDPKEKAMRILGEASGEFMGRLCLLCPVSRELDKAMNHVQQAVLFVKKAIEDAMNAPDAPTSTITWVEQTIHMDYGLGRHEDRMVTVANGTGLAWRKSSGTIKDPRDHFSVIHIANSHMLGPYFFSQKNVERYIERLLPLADWNQSLSKLKHFTDANFDDITSELGYEYTWEY